MAFSLNIANALSLGDWFNPGELNPRVMDQDQAPHPILNARNASTTAGTASDSVNMFLDALDEDYEFAASIVTACEDRTVYALQCTSAPKDIFSACGADGPIVTITAGTDYYEVGSTYVATTLGYTVTVFLDETCTLKNTAAVTCTATLGGETEGIATSLVSTVTLASPSYYRFDVAITGGAEKTKSPSPNCGAEGTATSSSSKGTATSSITEGAATSSSSKVTATSSSSEVTATSNNSEGAATSLNAKSMAIWALTGTFGVAGLLTML